MNKQLENQLVTKGSIRIKGSFVREWMFSDGKIIDIEKNEVKNVEWMFIDAYWIEEVEYKGEKKERYKYSKEEGDLRKIYETILKDYEVEKRIVKFIDVELLRNKYRDEKRGSESMGNICLFYGLRRKRL
jgi:hypothetical protein